MHESAKQFVFLSFFLPTVISFSLQCIVAFGVRKQFFNIKIINAKCQKIIIKNFLRISKFLYQKSYFSGEVQEVPRGSQGDPSCPHMRWWRGNMPAAPGHEEGPPGPSTYSPSSPLFLSPDQTHPNRMFSCACCSCPRIFDLLAQPIFVAEIWGIHSPVCDSSDYPSRILFGGLYVEYFPDVDIMFSEFECLF